MRGKKERLKRKKGDPLLDFDDFGGGGNKEGLVMEKRSLLLLVTILVVGEKREKG